MKLQGTKLGMSQVFSESGERVPVTVIHIEPHIVVSQKVRAVNGYDSLLLGVGKLKVKRASKAHLGQFESEAVSTKTLFESKGRSGQYKEGDTIDINIFNTVAFVDASAMSKGKGTQGVMKRWGFSGGRASHGSKFHRENGATGMAATPSKVLKGMKMSGNMGFEKKTVQNLKIVRVDSENQLLLIKGSVPGAKQSKIFVSDSIKKTIL